MSILNTFWTVIYGKTQDFVRSAPFILAKPSNISWFPKLKIHFNGKIWV